MIEKTFIEYIVKELADHPDEVVVECSEDDKGSLLKLSVSPLDIGRIIGRNGHTAQALRNVLRALGAKNNKHYNLKIVVNETKDESTDGVVVEKDESVTVENASDRIKKLQESIAELDDIDI